MSDKLLTVDELAARWDVKPPFVWRQTRQGRVPHVKIGRYYRYRLDAIEEFERAGGMDSAS